MRIETYKNYNPRAKHTIKPREILRENFVRINTTIRALQNIRPEIIESYLVALKKRLENEVKAYTLDTSTINLTELSDDLPLINQYPEFKDLIVKVLFKYLPLPKDSQPGLEEFEGIWVEALKGWFLVPYYRTKAFTDILGRENGIKFWKEMVVYLLDEAEEQEEGEIWPPIKEVAESWINGAKSGENQGFDFTVVIYDDYKVLLKFDRCCVHESLKYLDDQEIVYLSRCYTGELRADRTNRVRRKRLTQTLHCGEYCDEFYWDNTVHPNAENPDKDFIRNLGR
ncbi:MAG: hypothetical protein ACFFC7_27420 [Candidatus Hermodarchaeota archaeon]